MKRTRIQAWALKTRQGYFASRGALAFLEGRLPTALYKTKRNATEAAKEYDPYLKLVRPVKVNVTIEETL